jgi:hypothetical protein
MASLELVENKLVRAVEHLKALQLELENYFKSSPGHLLRESETEDTVSYVFQPKGPISPRIGFIVGDCLQNARSSLDYLVWELVLAAGNMPNAKNAFPICTTPDAFADQLKRKRLDGVDSDAVTEIRCLQPYHLGPEADKATLAVLERLTNINKHRRLLLTDLRSGQSNLGVVEKDGELWSEGSIPTLERQTRVALSRQPGQEQTCAQIFACITFGEGAAEGMEVTMCLNNWLCYLLEEIVPRFRRFFV